MRVGIFLRNFGPPATRELLDGCATTAQAMGLDDLWVSDHLAIAPDESEGSGGRYLDPLATLAFLAGITDTIGLGTSVLIVPYRPALATAKWLASIQELSGGRLTIGAAVGWMESEFKALGVDRRRRGAITDDTLAFWHTCFANDELESNGQRFIFSPRPSRPRFMIGGAAPHALDRVVRYGDGWMPPEGDPEKLREPIRELRRRFADAGKSPPVVIPLTALPLDDRSAAVDQVSGLAEVGVAGIDHAGKYASVDEFQHIVEELLEIKSRVPTGAD